MSDQEASWKRLEDWGTSHPLYFSSSSVSQAEAADSELAPSPAPKGGRRGGGKRRLPLALSRRRAPTPLRPSAPGGSLVMAGGRRLKPGSSAGEMGHSSALGPSLGCAFVGETHCCSQK